jgi:hypothetical protein
VLPELHNPEAVQCSGGLLHAPSLASPV